MQDIVPAYVDGIMVVLESETQAYTYEMREGTAYVVGKGDLHDANYDIYKAGPITLNDYKSYSNTSSTYSLSIYPTAIVFQEFETNTPTVVAVSLGKDKTVVLHLSLLQHEHQDCACRIFGFV